MSKQICRPGVEMLASGDERGLDPREMSQEEIRALGHEPMSPLKALRLRCVDCCGGQPFEATWCTSVKCPAWPFRTGKNPWRAPPSEAQRECARNLSARRGREGGEDTESACEE